MKRKLTGCGDARTTGPTPGLSEPHLWSAQFDSGRPDAPQQGPASLESTCGVGIHFLPASNRQTGFQRGTQGAALRAPRTREQGLLAALAQCQPAAAVAGEHARQIPAKENPG